MPGAKQQLRPGPDDLPGRHAKAGFFSMFYFKFHHVPFGSSCAVEAPQKNSPRM
jgi:hypothetical protein